MKKLASDGYVLGWVLIVMLAMSMLGLMTLSMSADYHYKVLEENWDRQAYYTARSVLELAVTQMTGEATDSSLAEAIREQIALDNMEFDLEVNGLNPAMGTCSLNVIYREQLKEIVLTAYSECNGKTGTIAVIIKGGLEEKGQPLEVMGYGDEQLRLE